MEASGWFWGAPTAEWIGEGGDDVDGLLVPSVDAVGPGVFDTQAAWRDVTWHKHLPWLLSVNLVHRDFIGGPGKERLNEALGKF